LVGEEGNRRELCTVLSSSTELAEVLPVLSAAEGSKELVLSLSKGRAAPAS